MKLLDKYIFLIFSSTFFPIFITLYTITSIIFLVKLASLTSIIQMNFLELLQLYSYSIPTILFYTLPISYFVGSILSISKLSSEYETIVITSFGLNPLKLLRLFIPTTLVLTIGLLIISLGLIPKATYLKDNFLNIKKQEAQFNIKPSEYGQQFGDWLLYVDKQHDKTYENITLLQLANSKDYLISATTAKLKHLNNYLSLKLNNGKNFTISTQNIQQIDFKNMLLNHKIIQPKNIITLNDYINYWDDRKQNLSKSKAFSFYILISLFPLLSLLYIVIIGYFNPRYDKDRTTMYGSIILIVYVAFANKLSALYPNAVLYSWTIFWLILSYIIYHITTKKSY